MARRIKGVNIDDGDLEYMKALLESHAKGKGEQIFDEIDRLSKDALNEVIAKSRIGRRKTKKYCTGWRRFVKVYNLGRIVVTIHNKTNPSLTHLLEKGHDNPRVGRMTKAYPHIGPVQKKLNEDVEKAIKRIMGANW